MNFSALFLHRLRWIQLPGALLIALLQRTPVLRVMAGAEPLVAGSSVAVVLRSAFTGLASLGAVQALAGATTFIVQQGQTQIVRDGDPPRFNNPANGTVGVDIAPVAFTVIGVSPPAPPASFQIKNLPPGLTVSGINSNGVVNVSTGVINGRPSTPGTFVTTITAYEFLNGPAQAGNDTVGPITVTFVIAAGAGVAPTFTLQPASQTVAPGGTVTLTASATGSPPPTYQWRKNGQAILGATSATLTIASAQAADAGDYSVQVSNSVGAVTSAVATVAVATIDPNARLTNLSVRTALAASQTLIVGVTVNGGARNVLVRAAGPALAAFGLTTAMTDPRLDLFNGSTLVFSNDDWAANLAPTFTSVGAFVFPAGSKDAAFVQSIDGGRSIQARGTGAGVVLVEAYDTGAVTPARLINVSARNRVGAGEDILIAGFNVAGSGAKQLLVRAVGPKLAAFGVNGVLADPKLEIYNSAGVKIVENDNWNSALAPTFSAVGAFALDSGSRDAALIVTLPPGSYTAQVRGADGGTGEALIEIYEAP